jgi:NADH-quinone oxidoreductase subunit A
MEVWVFSPPIVFILLFVVIALINRLLKPLAIEQKNPSKASREPYACGEPGYGHMARPDYSTFFVYAFFFTLAHVATLVMATVPGAMFSVFVMACIYLVTVSLSLYILLRKDI